MLRICSRVFAQVEIDNSDEIVGLLEKGQIGGGEWAMGNGTTAAKSFSNAGMTRSARTPEGMLAVPSQRPLIRRRVGRLREIELVDGGNRTLVRGVLQGRDFHQPPDYDAEDIEKALANRFRLSGVEFTLPCGADAEDKVGVERGTGRIR